MTTAPRGKGDDSPGVRWNEIENPEGELPELGDEEFLKDYLLEVGSGLSWAEIQAWQEVTQTPLTTWQLTTLHSMSTAYAASANAALDPKCPPPMISEEAHEKKQANMISALSSIAKRPAKNA